MRAVWIVFWREVTIRLKNWRFWLGTLSFPLLIFLVVALPALVARFSPEKCLQVLVAGNLPLPQEEGPFRFVPVPQTAVDSLKNLLQTADDLVLLVLPPNPVESEICTLYTAFSLSSEKMQDLKAILTEAFRAYRQEALRVTSNDILKVLTPPRLQVYKVSAEGATRYSAGLATAVGIFIGIALFILLVGAGYQILASVLEEKSNRLVEYMLLAADPGHILQGKILSGLVLSVFQVVVWGLAVLLGGGATFSSTLADDAQQSQRLMEAMQDQAYAVPWGWVVIFLIAGLLLYTFLYAAAGAASDSVTELSPLSQALQWPLLLSVIVLPTLAASGEGPVITVLSYFPLTSPIYMPVRLIASEVPGWEAVVSLGILVLTLVGAYRFATKIYQHALLLYGQKLPWKAIWQILRG